MCRIILNRKGTKINRFRYIITSVSALGFIHFYHSVLHKNNSSEQTKSKPFFRINATVGSNKRSLV
jgi:hypothetical protein